MYSSEPSCLCYVPVNDSPVRTQLALITGRNETYRPLTERNLKEQGFGVRCKRDGNDKPVRSHNGPCYVELDMRDLKSAPPAPHPQTSDPVSRGLLETRSLQ